MLHWLALWHFPPSMLVVANIFVFIVLGDSAAERSAVAFSSTSIAVAMARPMRIRTYSPTNIEGPDFADIPPLDLGACCNLSKE